MTIPYERIIQWSAGPVSIAAGALATLIVGGPHGADRNQIAQAIDTVGVFGVSAGVTYLAHHTWLRNLPSSWFNNSELPATSEPTEAELDVGPPADADPGAPLDIDGLTHVGSPS